MLVFAAVFSFSVTAFAADSSVTFRGAADGFDFQPGSSYTATDLFDSFKDVMPGDTLTETVKINNKAADCEYIKLYMKAVVHDEKDNPLTYSEAFEDADGKDQSDIDGHRDESVAAMQDFLSRLNMRIYNGDRLIFEKHPGESTEYFLLGKLKRGESATLTVKLEVPIELGNEYANRVGEVDWVFLAECAEQENNDVTEPEDDGTLILTGRSDRPVLLLGVLGALIILLGILLTIKRKKGSNG